MFAFICLKFTWSRKVHVYFSDHSVLNLIAILPYFIPCLIFVSVYLSGICSFPIEIIVTFSIKASGHGNLLCPMIFGRIFDFSW